MATDFHISETTCCQALRAGLDAVLLKGADSEKASAAVVDACGRLPGVESVWVWGRRGDGKLTLEAVGRVAPDLIDHLLSLPEQEPLVGILETGCVVDRNWADALGAAAADFRAAGLQRVHIVPALLEGNLEAAVGLAWSRAGAQPPDHASLARHAARLFGHLNRTQRLQRRLQELQDNAAQIFRGIEEVLFVVDAQARVLATNHGQPESGDLGDLDSMLPGGRRILDRRGTDSGPVDEGSARTLNQSRLRTQTGDMVPVEVAVKEIRWNDRPAFLLICTDISRRLVVEKERERLFTAIEQTADAVMVTDSSGSIQYTNPAFSKLTGYSAEEACGTNPRILKSGTHNRSFYRAMWSTIRRGENWKGRLVNRRKDGELYWEVATISPVRDNSGVITHFVGVKRDITQEVKLEQKWRQSQKLEAIGTLAGGIAHDFNNILYALLGNAQLAMDDIPDDHPARQPLTEIVKAGDRGAILVNKMLAFGRRQEGNRETLALQPVIREAMDLMRASLPSTVEMVLDLPAEPAHALVDETQIHQVILNLFNNAAHAMAGHGVCTLRLERTEVPENSPEVRAGLPPGPYHVLTFEDDGAGMAGDVMVRIFEPYFTTKKPNEGTGLGLASVHGIVKNHKGHISVASEPGAGTVFTIMLPEARAQEPAREAPRAVQAEVCGAGRIMVVDDEQMIVDVVARGLRKSGFKVESFLDGVQALEHFRRDPCAFDVVLTDQTMPNITGFELATQISSMRPDLPIVLSTGYSVTAEENDLRSAGISHFLHKPLKIKELARLMGEICHPLKT